MTKETLIQMGLTEEQATKVMESLDGSFVTKSRFNEVNTELNQAKEGIKERDNQLNTLKKSVENTKGNTDGIDIEALKKEISDLKATNKAKDEAHTNEIKALKFDTALNSALTGVKAKNPETVKPLLKAFLEKAELDGNSIKGLDDELKKLAESEETKFLFETQQKQATPPKGMTPGEAKDGTGNTNPNGVTLGEAIGMQIEAQFNQN